MRYFQIGLALPNSTFWVNLRPDAPDNIIDDKLAQTDIGRIMLEADVQLKKDTALFTSPQTPCGKLYWQKLYEKAEELFGSENITIPTWSRPWIIPDEVIIRQGPNSAYIYKASLKVNLEEDYFANVGAGSQPALQGRAGLEPAPTMGSQSDPRYKVLNEYSSDLIGRLILPRLTKEVNVSRRYASLRRVYYSLILARWFKNRYKSDFPAADKGNNLFVSLIDSGDLAGLTSQTSWSKGTYFRQYCQSFSEGEYNLKESVYTSSGQVIRRYVSGGIQFTQPMPGKADVSSPIGMYKAANDDLILEVLKSSMDEFVVDAQTGVLQPEEKERDELSGSSSLTEEIIPTGQTIDVAGLDRWTPERVLIDLGQNHIDETRIRKARLFLEGKREEAAALMPELNFVLESGETVSIWDVNKRRIKYKNIRKIIFSDSGYGYPFEMLKYRLSYGKKEGDLGEDVLGAFRSLGMSLPGGQFGEGQKMLAAVILSIQHNQEESQVPDSQRTKLTYRSQGWKAELIPQEVVINHQRGEIKTLAVAFRTSGENEEMRGSESIIENPTRELFDASCRIGELILDFNPEVKKLASSEKGEILQAIPGEVPYIYVRGYRISPISQRVLFIYNLNHLEVNRDRDQVGDAVYPLVGELILNDAPREVIEKIINAAHRRPSDYELYSYGHQTNYNFEDTALDKTEYSEINSLSEVRKEAWKQVFYGLFGKDAILASSSNPESICAQRAREAGKVPIILNYVLLEILQECGIETDKKYDPRKKEITQMPLGISLDYRAEKWGALRIALDFLQNHADAAREYSDYSQQPVDCGVEFKVAGKEEWLSWQELSNYENQQVTEIKFKDRSNGGYAYAHLAQMGSRKPDSASVQVGLFGEGLKLASAAALRLGFQVNLRSQKWEAEAYTYEVNVEKKDGVDKFLNLGFRVYENTEDISGSETIVSVSDNASSESWGEFLDIVRELKQYILRHQELALDSLDPPPLLTTREGDRNRGRFYSFLI